MRLAALVAIALAALSAHAAEITFSAASPMDARTATLRAQRIDGAAEAIERSVEIPGTTRVALPEGLWQLQLAGSDVWAPMMFAREADNIVWRVWPAVAVRGVARSATALRVAFEPLDVNGAKGEAECASGGGKWTCAIPRGRYDLRFTSRGAAPEFRFGVTVPSEREIALQFVAGASLSGRVDVARGVNVKLDDIELSLTAGGRRFAAKAGARGFFQFRGLPAGEYVLHARREGFVVQPRGVTIVNGAAAELNAPLLLDRPKRLIVKITPPLDPELRPWLVSLRDAKNVIGESAASPDGEWSHAALVAGEYDVDIRRESGAPWKSERVAIGNDDVTLPLMITSERVTGIVTLGERPLEAKLSFGGEHGAALHSNREGVFEGELPAGDDAWMVYVDAEAEHVKRMVRVRVKRDGDGARRIEIRLRNGSVAGRVLRHDRSPVPSAVITIDGNETHQVIADDDGTFQLNGLDAGTYRVQAEGRDARSEQLAVDIKDDESTDIELILAPQVVVRGRLGMGATPLVHANVYAIPRDAKWAPFMPRTQSNEHGRFALELPPRTSVYDIVAVHPAFDIITGRMNVQPGTTLHVVANQVGGTIIVDTDAPRELLLRHDGGEYWAHWLAGVAGGSVDASRIVLPRLEPGQYAACSSATNQCASGTLSPHGTLTLTVR